MQKCVVILGMHRSGTSALMGALNTLGVDIGITLMKPAEDNPKGFFENDHISRMNEKILESLISSWDDTFPLPENWWEQEWIRLYKKEISGIIEHEMKSDMIGIKDPRMCRLLPFWNPLFEKLRIKPYYILVVRNPLEVAYSLKKRNSFSVGKSLLLWMSYMLDAEFYSRQFPRVFISYDDLLKKPERTFNYITEKLGIRLPKSYEDVRNKVEQFLEPNLKHHTFGGSVNEELLKHIFDYYNMLLCLCGSVETSSNVLSEIDGIRQRHLNLLNNFYNDDIRNAIKEREIHIGNLDAHIKDIGTALKDKDVHIVNLETHARNLETVIKDKDVYTNCNPSHINGPRTVIQIS